MSTRIGDWFLTSTGVQFYPEAYCGDVIRPIKRQVPLFSEMEEKIWKAIAIRYDLPEEIPAEVKRWDDVALMTERRDLVIHTAHKWSVDAKPHSVRIIPMSPALVEKLFMNEFLYLYGKFIPKRYSVRSPEEDE